MRMRKQIVFGIVAFFVVAAAVALFVHILSRQTSGGTEADIGYVSQIPQVSDTLVSITELPKLTSRELLRIDELIDVFSSSDFNEKKRAGALGKLYAIRTEMTDNELKSFWASLLDVAKAQGLGAQFHSNELWVLNEIGLLLKYKGLLNQDEIGEQVGFLVGMSADENQMLAVRRMAITALGDLQVETAVPMLSDLLEDEQNWNTPELARSATIALSRLDPERALQPVADVLSGTTNSAVFGSAAYAMRDIDLPEVLATLTKNRHRMDDNISVDNTITELFPVVTNVLANPSSTYISHAIDATQSIWQEQQRTIIIQQLEDIVTNTSVSPSVRQQAAGQLLEFSKILPREDRRELLDRLSAITSDPQIGKVREEIRRESGVRRLAPKEK